MDCLEGMKQLPDESVDLVVTSPPYNEGKEYGNYNDNKSLEEWIEFMRSFLMEVKRILKEDGRICLNLSESNRSPFIPKPQIILVEMFKMGFKLRGDIIWKKPGYNGTAWGSWKSPSNPTITDNSEHILVASNKILKKGGRKNDIDILGDEFKEWITGHWLISPKSSKFHPCIYPEELVRRCIKLYSYRGDVILDPFIGSGTTAVACIQTARNFIGYEIDRKYYQIALERIKKILSNSSPPIRTSDRTSDTKVEFNTDLKEVQKG